MSSDHSIARNTIQDLLSERGAERITPDIDGREVWLLEDGATIVQFDEGFGRIEFEQFLDICIMLGLSTSEVNEILLP